MHALMCVYVYLCMHVYGCIHVHMYVMFILAAVVGARLYMCACMYVIYVFAYVSMYTCVNLCDAYLAHMYAVYIHMHICKHIRTRNGGIVLSRQFDAVVECRMAHIRIFFRNIIHVRIYIYTYISCI